MSEKVFESELTGGIKYELYVSQGFSERSEIALKVEDKIVSIINLERRRTGSIICKPVQAGVVRIKKPREENQEPLPNLDDVIDEPCETDSDDEE